MMAEGQRPDPLDRRRSNAGPTEESRYETFAVVMVCADAGCGAHAELLDALRPAVRRSRQAVLMRTTCVSGRGCLAGRSGSMVRLQRCSGRADVVLDEGWLCGPFTEAVELDEVLAWLNEEEQHRAPRPG